MAALINRFFGHQVHHDGRVIRFRKAGQAAAYVLQVRKAGGEAYWQ